MHKDYREEVRQGRVDMTEPDAPTYEDVLELLDELENEDDVLPLLEQATEFYCSMYDRCEGLKHALRLTLNDEYTNHASEQDPEDLAKLVAKLTAE